MKAEHTSWEGPEACEESDRRRWPSSGLASACVAGPGRAVSLALGPPGPACPVVTPCISAKPQNDFSHHQLQNALIANAVNGIPANGIGYLQNGMDFLESSRK